MSPFNPLVGDEEWETTDGSASEVGCEGEWDEVAVSPDAPSLPVPLTTELAGTPRGSRDPPLQAPTTPISQQPSTHTPPNAPRGSRVQETDLATQILRDHYRRMAAQPQDTSYNYQPQVASTEDGPVEYNYIPRFDDHQSQFLPYGGPPAYQPPPAAPPAYPPAPAANAAPEPVPVNGGSMIWDGAQWLWIPGLNQQVPQAPAAQGQYYAQPQPPQPAVLPAPAAQPQYYNYPQPGPPPAPANAPPLGYAPVTVPMGVDLTGREALARDIVSAHGNRTYEAQSFAPADPDPHRMYWCRELDHTWTHRNRLTIESGDIGDHTWYISPTDNSFYAALKEKVPS